MPALDDFTLEIILRLALAEPNPASSTSLMLVCKRWKRKILYVVFRAQDTSRWSAATCRKFLLLLDPLFQHRLADYSMHLSDPASTTLHHRVPLYPFNPHSIILAASRGPEFRRHIEEIRLFSRWDVSHLLRPITWPTRGFPFTAVPIVCDLVRACCPGLRRLVLDLPKSIVTEPARQNQINALVQDIVNRVAKFGMLEMLVLDVWELGDVDIETIMDQCKSLVMLGIRRATLSSDAFALAMTDREFGLNIRSLSISNSTMDLDAISLLLKSCLSLQTLQFINVSLNETNWTRTTLPDFVDACHPKRRRFPPPSPTIAPITSLVIRLSYRCHASEHHLPLLIALWVALSPTLVNLHLGVQISSTAFLLPFSMGGICPSLRRLWIGFMYAKDEVGDGVRLNVGDDGRSRPGLKRGDEYLAEGDVLHSGRLDVLGRVPALSEETKREARRAGGLVNERVVLGRVGLEESLVRHLIDAGWVAPTWPSPGVATEWRVLQQVLAPFPHLWDAIQAKPPRTTQLDQFHLFETELVGSLARRRERGFARTTVGHGVVEAWQSVMSGNFGV